MSILKINEMEYDMSSPSGLEFKNKYITMNHYQGLPLIGITLSLVLILLLP